MPLSQDEILRQATNAEPFAPFRQRFYYNNVQYLAAGTASAAAAGESWDALIDERILLPVAVLGRVPEILLGAAPALPSAAGEFEEYVGRYIANFGAFSNEAFTVLEEGRLALDIPSERVYALNPPNDAGLWSFALTDQIAIAFERDDTGDVVGFTLHQFGMAFEVPREGIEIEPEIELSELARYLGEYHGEEGLVLGLEIQNQRLALRFANNAVLDLNRPDADGRWSARANAELGVAFEETEDGTVAAMAFYRPGGLDALRLVRG